MQFGREKKGKAEIAKSVSRPRLFGGEVIRHYDKNGKEIGKSYSTPRAFRRRGPQAL